MSRNPKAPVVFKASRAPAQVERVEVHVRSADRRKPVLAEANLLFRHEIANFKKPAIARALRALADSLDGDG